MSDDILVKEGALNAVLNAADKARNKGPDVTVSLDPDTLETAIMEARRTERRAFEFDADAKRFITAQVRTFTYALTGGNCTYVDDDLKVLTGLARWALENGVPDEVAPNIVPHAKKHLAEISTEPEPELETGG